MNTHPTRLNYIWQLYIHKDLGYLRSSFWNPQARPQHRYGNLQLKWRWYKILKSANFLFITKHDLESLAMQITNIQWRNPCSKSNKESSNLQIPPSLPNATPKFHINDFRWEKSLNHYNHFMKTFPRYILCENQMKFGHCKLALWNGEDLVVGVSQVPLA